VTAALDVVAAVCLVAGALLSLAAGVALVRFPDLLSRMHAATKPQVLGLLLVLLGCGLRLRDTVDTTTLLLVAVFQLGTAPVAAHMIGRAGYRAGQARADLLLLDELAERADRVNPATSHPRTPAETTAAPPSGRVSDRTR
jgi:multicomponent Na+:H+ antiporter subunit G